MRVIITGASGLLGHYLTRTARPGVSVYGTVFQGDTREGRYRYLDLLDLSYISEIFNAINPTHVIHCAGDGRVDEAERSPQRSFETNVTGTANLLHRAERHGCHFTYISSNAVYDGLAPPYNEESERRPANTYGVTKVEAERRVFGYQWKSTIIRPILLYGSPPDKARGNLATRVIETLRGGGEIKVADDIYTQPTYVKDLAQAIWRVVTEQKVEKEVLNMAPREKMSLFEFAVQVAKTFELDPAKVVPVKSEDLKSLAPRPKDTTFDVSKMEAMGVKLLGAREGLIRMKNDIT